MRSRSESRSRKRSRFGRRRRRRHGRSSSGLGAVLASPHVQNTLVVLALLAVAGSAAQVSRAAPSGLDVADMVWVGGLTAVVAFFAGYGRRWTWFLPAGAGALLAADKVVLVFAGVAVVLGMLSVVTDLRSRSFAALVVGSGMVALLQTNSVGFHGANSLLTAVLVLPVIVSGYRLASRPTKRLIGRTAGWIGAVGLLVVGGAAVGVVMVSGDLVKGARAIDRGIAAARDADTDGTQEEMGEASRYLHSAEATLTSWFVQPAHALPFVGPNVRAVSEMARDTAEVTTASGAAAEIANLDNLRFEDGRLDPRRIDVMIEPLESVADSARSTRDTVDRIDSPWLVEPVQRRMDDLSSEVDQNLPDLGRARDAVEVAGPLIGGDGDRRYLVLFTTPTEARGRTGFPGNYAELTFVDGKLEMPEFGRIGELERGGDPGAREITDQEDFLARYGRFDPQTTWRNITMSPDFPTVADVAMQLYPQSGFDREVDGVLSVDPTGLAALMHFTGPIDLEDGTQLTADNVAEFLHLDQYLTYDVHDERVDFLGDVAEEVFERLTELSMGETTPSEIIEVLGEAAEGNHIQFTTRFEDEAAYFDEIGIDGSLPPSEGDSLAVTTTNIGPNKIDTFLNRHLAYDLIWDPATGAVAGTVTATLRNQAPADSLLPEYVVGNREPDLPWGYNRSYVSIYSPWALTEARVDGEPAAVHPEQELGRYAYATYVDIPPGEAVTIDLDVRGTWAVPFYSLMLAPAPLVSDEELQVSLTVAGDDDFIVGASDDGWAVDGRTIRFDGYLNRPLQVGVAMQGTEEMVRSQENLTPIE